MHDDNINNEAKAGWPVNLLPGAAISLQSAGGARVNVRLLGVVQDAYIALRDVPARHGLMEFSLGYGESVVVRYLHEGAAVGFRSYVLNSLREPERLLFVAYPREIQQHALRQADRIRCTFPCQLSVGSEVAAAVMVDLSETGCQCAIRRRAGMTFGSETLLGEPVVVQLVRLDGEQTSLRGVVRRAVEDEQAIRVGIQFESAQPALFAEMADVLRPLSEVSS
jgi:c-di-GMP-binding flagellar brake protein YcgR